MGLERFFKTALYGIRHVKDTLGDELPDRGTIRFKGVPVSDDPESKETVIDFSSLPVVPGVASVLGTAPIEIDDSDPQNPVVTIRAASSTLSGSMSAFDKAKLNNMFPLAQSGPITLSTAANTTTIGINNATTMAAGAMSATDKSKLDSIGFGAVVQSVNGVGPTILVNNSDPQNPIIELDYRLEVHLPLSLDNSTPENPQLSIVAATSSQDGYMSSADKQKLDDATDVAAPGKLVLYTASSGICVDNVTACSGNNLVLGSDGFAAMTLDGQSTGNLLVPSGIRSSVYMLQTATENVSRALPMNWNCGEFGGAPTWVPLPGGDAYATQAVPEAELTFDCNFLHGMKIKSLTLRHKGAGTGANPLPLEPPVFTLYRKVVSTGVATAIASQSAVLDGTFRGNWRDITLDLTATPHTVDTTDARYYILVTSEHDVDAIPGDMIRGVTAVFDFPVGFAIGLG